MAPIHHLDLPTRYEILLGTSSMHCRMMMHNVESLLFSSLDHMVQSHEQFVCYSGLLLTELNYI